MNLDTIPTVLARWWTPGRARDVRLIVVHTPEFPELNDGAERLASYFATTTRRASVHCTVDSDSVVRSVYDTDTAYGAENANADGLHVELVGYAGQTADEWADDYSRAVIARAADLIRSWATRWDVPLRLLAPSEIAAGSAGIAGHADVYQALGGMEVRTDPGPAFPWAALAAQLAAPAPQEEPDVFWITGQTVYGVPVAALMCGGRKVAEWVAGPNVPVNLEYGIPEPALADNGRPGMGARFYYLNPDELGRALSQ